MPSVSGGVCDELPSTEDATEHYALLEGVRGEGCSCGHARQAGEVDFATSEEQRVVRSNVHTFDEPLYKTVEGSLDGKFGVFHI